MEDVLVLGAGVIGLATAVELARRGARVRILERNKAGREASWAAGGMLAPFTEELAPGYLHDLAVSSLAMYPEFASRLAEETGVDIQLQLNGILDVALDDVRMHTLRHRAQALQSAGRRARILSRDDLTMFEGGIQAHAYGALLCEEEGQVENRRLVRALLGAARVHGVQVDEHTEVLALEANARRVLGVRTAHGFVAAPIVVNALGAWAGGIAGVPEAVQAAVYPVKGQMLALAMPRHFLKHVVWGAGVYLIPRADGRLVVGATVENAGFDRRVTAEGVHSLLTGALELVPGAAGFALCESWVGHRPQSRDAAPMLGETVLTGYYHANGHYRNGILLAPVTAAVLAAAIAANGRTQEADQPDSYGMHEKTRI